MASWSHCSILILCKGGKHVELCLKRCEVSFAKKFWRRSRASETPGLKSTDSLTSTSRRSAFREAMVNEFLDVSWINVWYDVKYMNFWTFYCYVFLCIHCQTVCLNMLYIWTYMICLCNLIYVTCACIVGVSWVLFEPWVLFLNPTLLRTMVLQELMYQKSFAFHGDFGLHESPSIQCTWWLCVDTMGRCRFYPNRGPSS